MAKTRYLDQNDYALQRKPAGKHPQLRPVNSATTAATPTKVTKPAARTSKQTSPTSDAENQTTVTHTSSLTATRRILTRSQSKVFRLLDLPAELRNNFYQQAGRMFSATLTGQIDLETLFIPQEFSINRQIRAEALPVFFASNHFKVAVTSNYCVRYRHFHSKEDFGYREAGLVHLPRFLRDLPEAVVRLKHVTLEVSCICCDPGKKIAELGLEVKGDEVETDCRVTVKPAKDDPVTKPRVEVLCSGLRDAAAQMGRREGFNGFTLEDLETVAQFVRVCRGTNDQHGEHEH